MGQLRLICFIALFMSCQTTSEERAFIEEDRLVSVISDLHFIEASLIGVNKDNRDSVREVALKKCAEIHQLTVEELEDQIFWLENEPEYQRQIYRRVVETLEGYMEKADSLAQSNNPKKTDRNRPDVTKFKESGNQ